MGNQILSRIKWHIMKPDTPKPMLFPPKDGWITDPKEIENAIRLDDHMGIKEHNERKKDE